MGETSQPLICKDCWPKKANHYGPCEHVMQVYNAGVEAGKLAAPPASASERPDTEDFHWTEDRIKLFLKANLHSPYLMARILNDREDRLWNRAARTVQEQPTAAPQTATQIAELWGKHFKLSEGPISANAAGNWTIAEWDFVAIAAELNEREAAAYRRGQEEMREAIELLQLARGGMMSGPATEESWGPIKKRIDKFVAKAVRALPVSKEKQ